MSDLCLLGLLVPDWVSNWLTPLWILGAGALVGLVALLLVWLVALVLSRLPVLGTLAEKPGLRRKVVAAATAALSLGLLGYLITMVMRSFSQEGAQAGGDALVSAVFVFLPGGVLLWVLARCVVALVARRTVAEVPEAVREGVLWPLLIATVCLAVFGVLSTVVIREPLEMLASIPRLLAAGTHTLPPITVPATAAGTDADAGPAIPPEQEIAVDFDRDELQRLVFRSSENLAVTTEPTQDLTAAADFEIAAGEDFAFVPGEKTISPFVDDRVTALYARNLGTRDATLNLTVVTAAPHPEVRAIPITAVSIVIMFLFYVIQRATMPKLSAVALSTFKSEVAQPLFMIIVALGSFFLVLFIWIPYNTFGEDIKVLKDSGLTLIMVLCIIQAVWAASTSVAEEIEGRTALTVLSKPIGRRSFIIGKFLGILWTVALMFILMGLVFLFVVAYKPIYDAKETAGGDPTWQLCYFEMIRTVPGLVLAFMETIVLTALSVAISTRLPMLANFVICFSIYVLGHLTPLIVQSSAGQFEIVAFVGQLIATIFPNLEHFNIQAAVATGANVPHDYLGWALVYCFIYSLIAMLLALVMFEDRDLA